MFKCVNCGCNMMFSRCDGDKEVWVCSDCGTINNNNFLAEFQRGYEQALDDVFKKAKEMQLEQIKNLEQSSKRNGKMWARYMITYLGHIENTCKRLLKDGEKNDEL